MSETLDSQRRVVGQYVLERKIGEGGMAEVWLARHRSLETPAAVKFLNARFAGEPEIEARFLGEGKLQARLTQLNAQGANILPVFDYMEEKGRSYLVMRYIEGFGLDERIHRARGPLPMDETLSVARDVLGALGYAHSQGVIHRDVKPSNVLLEGGKRAFLMDFGIALARNVADRRTRVGAVMGTPHYMSPEQIEATRDVTPAADIYSFGCVLYEMLTGRTPFDPGNEATDFEIRRMHVYERAERPSRLNAAVTPELDAVTMRCLEKRAADRYADCAAVLRALSAPGGASGGGRPQRTDTVVIDPAVSAAGGVAGGTVAEMPVPESVRGAGSLPVSSNSGVIRLPPLPGAVPAGPSGAGRSSAGRAGTVVEGAGTAGPNAAGPSSAPVSAPVSVSRPAAMPQAVAGVPAAGGERRSSPGLGGTPSMEETRRLKRKKQMLARLGAAFAAAVLLSGGIALWQREAPPVGERVTKAEATPPPAEGQADSTPVAGGEKAPLPGHAVVPATRKAAEQRPAEQRPAEQFVPARKAQPDAGPSAGSMVWMGSVAANELITFYPTGRVSTGAVQGLMYPMQPLTVQVRPAALYDVVQMPSAANQWELVVRARYGGDARASIAWSVAGR